MAFYKHIFKPILFRFDPEAVHDFFTSIGQLAGRSALGRGLVRLTYQYRGPEISKTVDGIIYRTPFLLSAGFDYNGQLSGILPCIGLGGEEIGSVTARPCEGNPKPRLTRLPRSQSILVNKGLRNEAEKDLKKSVKAFMKEASPQDMGDAALLLEKWKHVKAFAKLCRSLGRNA